MRAEAHGGTLTLTLVVECLKCGWFREIMPPDPRKVPSSCPACASRLDYGTSVEVQEKPER